jgi:hypothetical protein
VCEVTEMCTRRALFWVQSRREIQHPGNPEIGVEPFRSGVNVSACSRCLPVAVRRIGGKNREAAGNVHLPATDGVIVKTRMPNGSWQ